MNNVGRYDKAVDSYMRELNSLGVSEKTIANYSRRLMYFREFWLSLDTKNDPTPDDIRSWRDSLIDKSLSPATIRQYLVELNAFFSFASDEERCGTPFYSANPVSKRMYPRIKGDAKKPYDKVLSADDIKKLWVNQKTSGKDYLWARDYAIVTLLLDGKIRNSELLDLRLCDIHFADNDDPFDYLIVNNGKGSKYREVDLTAISVSALKLYLKSGIRPKGTSEYDYLFGTTAEHKFGGTSIGKEDWHRGSSQWLSNLVKNHVKKVTGKSGFRTHSMRHNGAIMELNNGASLEYIQAELGHSSVQTTHIYAGRLQSKRNRMNMADVYAVRDEWAEKNEAMLAMV